jgi:FlaG/FlaF family flagellin (archaellin)
MTKKRGKSDTGVSDLIGTILIIILVIGLAAVIAAFLMPGLLQKSVYIASQVSTIDVAQSGGTSIEVLSVLPEAGEPFHIIGQKNAAGGASVSVKALSPDGRIMSPDGSSLSGNLYGKQLYIYPSEKPGAHPCELNISDTLPTYNLREMVHGKWTIQFVDEDAHILVMSNSDGVISRGLTSLAKVSGSPGDLMYRADCSLLPNTSYGNLPNRSALYNATMNMFYKSFDGSTQYYQYPNDPSLVFTGDLGISMWIDPTNLGVWNTIIGKGILNSDNSEYDNYQLVAIGNVLYFEWNNADGTHYHSQTNSPALTQGVWQYVTVNVQQNGQPQMYVNGVLQPSQVYTGNVPNAGSPSTATVNLQDNNYPVKIGKQNSDSNPFYYNGNIGNTALYNRVLTANEIQQNLQTYSA